MNMSINNAMQKEALLKSAAKSSSKEIGAQLHAQHDANQDHDRKIFMKLLSCIRYLSWQLGMMKICSSRAT